MFFIGDVHGKWSEYFDWIEVFDTQKSIQLGDMGFGFSENIPKSWDINHRFIRGNHDDPAACNAHPNHLGDYGVTEDGIFFVGGGYSIDVAWRKSTQYKYKKPIWWEDEEIAETEFEKILELYKSTKPKIVISHDCPSEIRAILPMIKNDPQFRNRTSDGLLSAMFKAHTPELWVFGHYHESFDKLIDKTRFVCLKELEVFSYELN